MSSNVAIVRLLSIIDAYAEDDLAPSAMDLQHAEHVAVHTVNRALKLGLVYWDKEHPPYGLKRHLTHAEREERRLKKLRKQMREQDKARFANPDANAQLERVWVVYAWQKPEKCACQFLYHPNGECRHSSWSWHLAGFVRRRNRRRVQSAKRFMASIRRKLDIERETPIDVIDLASAHLRVRRGDTSWQFDPPHHRETTRPLAPITQELRQFPKATRRRFTKAPLAYTPRVTRFVALGVNQFDRNMVPLYLGPLEALNPTMANDEAAKAFGAIYTVMAVDVKTMSAKLRGRIRRGRTVRPGVTRLLWPEPPSIGEITQMSEAQLSRIPRASIVALIQTVEKELARDVKEADVYREAKRENPDEYVEYGLAVLMFLQDELATIYSAVGGMRGAA